MANELQAHLAAIIAGKATGAADAPSEETLDLSSAIVDCIHQSASAGELGDEVDIRDALFPRAEFLPLLP